MITSFRFLHQTITFLLCLCVIMYPVIPIPNLIEIASANLAINLWKSIDIFYNIWRKNRNDNWNSLLDNVLVLTNQLPNPESQFVRKYVVKISRELDSWVSYTSHAVLNQCDKRDDLYCNLDRIVWYPNGTINEKETARNLMDSPRLSDVDKYHLMCTYCLKDEIKQLSSNANRVDFETDPLIFYWNCYFRNKLHEIPVGEGLSIDASMCQQRFVDNWAAKEYFFDRLSSEEKIQVAISLIDRCGVKYQKQVLMKLDDSQRYRVLMVRAVEIVTNYGQSDEHLEDLLSTWHDVRNIITLDQFISIVNKLSKTLVAGGVLKEIWITARSDFKRHILKECYNEKLAVRRESSELSRLFDLWFNDPSELARFRHDLTKIGFFDDNCKLLIRDKSFPTLAKMIRQWFPNPEELKEFKLDLIQKQIFNGSEALTEEKLSTLEQLLNLCTAKDFRFELQLASKKFIIDYGEKLLIANQLTTFEHMLKICFSNDLLLTEFKRSYLRKSFFYEHSEILIAENKIQTLDRLLTMFLTEKELVGFKENLAMQGFFINHCKQLIASDRIQTLEKWINLCMPNGEVLQEFKEYFTHELDFVEYCDNLISRNKMKLLRRFLKIFISDTKDSAYMRGFVYILASLRTRCSQYLCDGNLEALNNLLAGVLGSYTDIILEYKQNLLKSSNLVNECMACIDSKADRLLDIINDCYPDPAAADEIKKSIIFSNPVIEKLKFLLFHKYNLSKVKKIIDGFLSSHKDKKILKKRLIESETSTRIIDFFLNHDVSVWQSVTNWCFGNGKEMEKWKAKLPLDAIFEALFKNCVFRTYDERNRASRCSLKADFDFTSLDTFLYWYFDTKKEIKDYKLQRINSYQNIVTFDTLLKKNFHLSYSKKLTDWFFEGNSVEIVKFKKKHRDEKIADVLKISVRETRRVRNRRSNLVH